ASLLPRPTVDPSGVLVPFGPIGAQLVEFCAGGGAVCCIGVAPVGGACASAATGLASSAHENSMIGFIRMKPTTSRRDGSSAERLRIWGTGQARMPPPAAPAAARPA